MSSGQAQPSTDGALDVILAATDALDRGDDASARAALRALEVRSRSQDMWEERLARLFATGLWLRLDDATSGRGNPYVESAGAGRDMIAAFDVLVSSTPFIRFGYAAANVAISAVDTDALHIVDIGIGRGSQWPVLLDALASRESPPSLRLTGVDLPAAGHDAGARLKAVGETLARAAAARGVAFGYRWVAARMEDLDLDALVLRDDEALAVNLAFALHHTATDAAAGREGRDAVLERLRMLRPEVVTLVEPDSEHDILPLARRVREALGHYGAVFRALERLLPADHPARATIEEGFFGREIVNVVGFDGRDRVERHQRHRAWNDRLRRLGFRQHDLASSLATVAGQVSVESPAVIAVDDGSLVLSWEGNALVAASAWAA